MMKIGAGMATAAVLAACGGPSADELIKKIEKNPADAESAARLAMIGKAAAAGLFKLLDSPTPRARQAAAATLLVAGDVCTVPCIEYLEQGESHDVKLRILKIIAKGRWNGAVRKLVNRLDHSKLGPKIYECLTNILAGQTTPQDPWSVEGAQREERFAQWTRWLGANSGQYLLPSFAETRFSKNQFAAARRQIESELADPAWSDLP